MRVLDRYTLHASFAVLLLFDVGSVCCRGHGDEATLVGGFAGIEKFGEAVPGFVFLRDEAEVNDLPDLRMGNPVRVQMQRGPTCQFVV